ncbi:hypothetical protein P167DRAFT_519300 [Morchella conica CCBAS932]|uniref:SGTA homodimerisation domain-containing protein n=1 Tax=Morchella conica CCBAS932 TaxID=1392247 RepID=A0A3N4KWW4_9PEZI|nr:hypothetical protein P167DRAFT_519300 [Morchella conica CCBAS932]
MATESKKRLALAIIDFLTNCTKDGTVSPDDHESLEVASQCIQDAFKVDPTDKAALADALGGQSLTTIYGVFEKMKAKATPAAGASSSTPSAATPKPTGPSDADKAAAEALKTQGNAAMSKKDYKAAIDLYTQALALNPLNPIYLSNRAAAYSSSGNYDAAIEDAQVAVDTDPKYTKAWSRLGLARFAKGDARGSMEAYKAGIDAEGNGGSDIMRRGYETAKRRVEEEEGDSDDESAPATRGAGGGGMPDLGGLASLLGGAGGGAGGGGMPDLSSIMSNPMFSQMAQNLMSNPQLMQGLMNNPRLRDMMESVGGGGGGAGGAGGAGGMPDLGSLMSDPSIAEMARSFMGGGAGGAGGAGRGAGAGSTPP